MSEWDVWKATKSDSFGLIIAEKLLRISLENLGINMILTKRKPGRQVTPGFTNSTLFLVKLRLNDFEAMPLSGRIAVGICRGLKDI
jgi:hypothetical protein